MSSIQDKITNIITEQLSVEPSKVQPQASFQDDLGADSIDIVTLIMEFESAFDISIPNEVLTQMKTVQQAIDYVTSHTH